MASENDLPDNEDIKKKALARLALAGLVTAAALGGLWWLDQGKQAPSKKAIAPPQPAPIRPAQPSEPPLLPQAETGELPPAQDPSQQAPGEVVPDEVAAPKEAPPPPHVSNAPRVPPRLSEPSPVGQAPQGPLSAAMPAPPPAPLPAALPPINATGSFVVQLGVFASPSRAEELVRQLKGKGIRAATETRVHVGPFLNRQEAEKAQTEMRRLGLNGVVTTAAPTK